MAPYLSAHPGINMNVRGETMAIGVLNRMGFQKGMTNEQLQGVVAANGWGAFLPDGTSMLGSILQQYGILPQNLDPAEYISIVRWIWSTLNERPQKAQADAAKAATKGIPVNQTSGSLLRAGVALSTSPNILNVDGNQSFLGQMWQETKNIGAAALNSIIPGSVQGINAARELGTSQSENYMQSLGVDPGSPEGQVLMNQFNRPNARTSPVLEKILAGSGETTNSYVKVGGRIIRMDQWIKQAPGWQSALANGRVQIAHASDSVQEQLGGQTTGIENSLVNQSGNLEFNTTAQEMGAVGPLIDGTRGRATSENIFGMDDRTIKRLAEEIGIAVDKNF
jgi:hypothetical protein